VRHPFLEIGSEINLWCRLSQNHLSQETWI
jgi:hypothetical protein